MDEAGHYGYHGGLKAIEKKMGFKRKCTDCVDGQDAVVLWDSYVKNQSQDILHRILAYNQDDVMSLTALANTVIKLSLENKQIFDN